MNRCFISARVHLLDFSLCSASGNFHSGFVLVPTHTHTHTLTVMATRHRSLPVWPLQSDLSVRSYYRDCGVTQVTDWGQRAEAPLPPPIITLLSPSTSADSQWVLLFSSHHRLLRDKSLAELNRHTCVTPGYRALSLILFLNWRSVLFSGLCAEVHLLKSTSLAWGRGKLFYPRRGVPSYYWERDKVRQIARRGQCLGSKQKEAPMCRDRLWCP